LAGIPVLWHVREILSMPRPIRWILHKTLSLCADRIVCISQAVRDSLFKEAPQLAGKSVVVYNAVSVAASNGKVKDIPLREELGVPPGAPLVGMVGRITHWKGQEILAEAAGLSHEAAQTFTLSRSGATSRMSRTIFIIFSR
jgi:glycosyltransferase involved in cell wall biosynthesis